MIISIYGCAGFALTDDITGRGVQIRADGVVQCRVVMTS